MAASDLTAYAIAILRDGCTPEELPSRMIDYAKRQKTVYHSYWLKDLWQRPFASSPEEFISRGWGECLKVLEKLERALLLPDHHSDPCLSTGLGWIAEEALATGLLCFLLYPKDSFKALQRAAVTSGDSDSIACLTGAFAGAYHGYSTWSRDWVEKIEYKNRLEAIAQQLST